MTSPEGTTMEYIAAVLWINDTDNPAETWGELPIQVKQRYRQLAVQIIDMAEPIWRARVGIPGTEFIYGNQIRLSEEAHGPDMFVYGEYPEADARAYAKASNNIRLVRKLKTEWEIVE